MNTPFLTLCYSYKLCIPVWPWSILLTNTWRALKVSEHVQRLGTWYRFHHEENRFKYLFQQKHWDTTEVFLHDCNSLWLSGEELMSFPSEWTKTRGVWSCSPSLCGCKNHTDLSLRKTSCRCHNLNYFPQYDAVVQGQIKHYERSSDLHAWIIPLHRLRRTQSH